MTPTTPRTDMTTPTPPAAEPGDAPDARAGMRWWNALTEPERAAALAALPPGTSVADAWAQAKREALDAVQAALDAAAQPAPQGERAAFRAWVDTGVYIAAKAASDDDPGWDNYFVRDLLNSDETEEIAWVGYQAGRASLATPSAASQPPTGDNALWRHVKTGGIYESLMVALRESDRAPLIVYRNVETGQVWARPATEFNDGRFVLHARADTASQPTPEQTVAAADGYAWVPRAMTQAQEDAAARELTACGEDYRDAELRGYVRASYAAAVEIAMRGAALDHMADNARALGLDYGDGAPDAAEAAPVQAGPSNDDIDALLDALTTETVEHPDIDADRTRGIVRQWLARYGSQPVEPFQARVRPWLLTCFGAEIAADKQERSHRFLEEALELVQACRCTASEAHQLVEYVFGRPVGEPAQEVGGVMVTLAALCLAHGLDMHAEAETELARIWAKVDQIRAKQAAKPKHSPLPVSQPAAGQDAQARDVAPLFDDAPADRELLRRVVRYVVQRRGHRARWVAVSDAFALGSTYSARLCRAFGIDPDGKVGRLAADATPGA